MYIRKLLVNLDYPDSMRWQHIFVPQLRLVDLRSADVATRAALPQNRTQMLIGPQHYIYIHTKTNRNINNL